jgi:transposase
VGTALARAQNKAADAGRRLVWRDPSGCSLLPQPGRTWARCRQTPVLNVPLTRAHRSAIGALSRAGRLVLPTPPGAYHRTAVVGFRRVLVRTISGTLLILWDGAPSHRGKPSKAFLARGAAKRLHLEQLPGYAPDLNPVEGIWASLTCRELGTVCCQDFPALDRALRRAKERLRHKRHVLPGGITACGYSV